MQKTIIAVITLAVIGAGLYYILTNYTPSPDALSELRQPEAEAQGESLEGEEGMVAGTVVAVNLEQAMVDGPYLIMLENNGMAAVIAVPSMGLPTCAARANIADVTTIAVGQYVEARGTVGEGNVVIPCESPEHYLRVVEPS